MHGNCGCPPKGCCSPSIATELLCYDDGRTLAVVFMTPCASCGCNAPAPTVQGWFDLATGVFTAGNPPTGGSPCAGGSGNGEPVVVSDTELLTLCDDNGPFLRRLTFDGTGAVTSSADLDLAGAAYVPVGAVGPCQVPDDEDPQPLTARHFMLADGQSWTPADVGGAVITGLTYTVLSGEAEVVDASGGAAVGLPAPLSASWDDDRELGIVPPQQIIAVGGRVYVTVTTGS